LVDYDVIMPNIPILFTHPEHWAEKIAPPLNEKYDVQKNVEDVVIFGEVTYRDVVSPKVPRFTRFCVERATLPSVPFTACPIFNDMR
jgi:hypothetical protein